MFASLKSKIKEETGSDLSKLTSNWRNGAFLGRIGQKDDSTASPSSSGGLGDSTSESISPQLEVYLNERTGGHVDQASLQQQYTNQLEEKLKERDSVWERKLEQMKISLSSSQSEETMAAQTVARSAQAEASKACSERDNAIKQLSELRERLAAAESAQNKLDALIEELEQSRRDWTRERSELSSALSEAEAKAQNVSDELAVVRAALPPDSPHHHMDYDERQSVSSSGCADYDRVCRERAVLKRQLQEAKMALADVKTSWSGQIASLETQDKTMDFESRLNSLLEDNKGLTKALEQERALVKSLQEQLERTSKDSDDKQAELTNLNSIIHELQHDCCIIERNYEKEKREKDDVLLRNAHMSQTLELSQCNVRYQETELAELRTNITELENTIAQHKENQAACMVIKENEVLRNDDIQKLKERIDELVDNENKLKKTVQELETDLSDKNKKIKTLDNRILDMKKTLQRELQSSKSDLSTAEEADISRRYLKHVVLRFLTARELEARQLTRALSTLLRLSAHEEALLRAALPPRSGLSAWFPSLNT